MDYLTAKEAAAKWGVSPRWVHKLCQDGRVEGTRRFGRNWMIPADAEKPADPRFEDNHKPCGAPKARRADERDE